MNPSISWEDAFVIVSAGMTVYHALYLGFPYEPSYNWRERQPWEGIGLAPENFCTV